MRPLRPLLPAAKGSHCSAPEDRPSNKRKISLACEACRQRRSKCDGVRPVCELCRRHKSTCTYTETESRRIRQRYEELQKREAIHEELVRLLRNMADQDAAEVHRRLRAGTDVASILKHIREGNLLLQLSLTPDTRRIYEFPYSSRMPSHLVVEHNLYLDSWIYKASQPSPVPGSSPHSGGGKDDGEQCNTSRSEHFVRRHITGIGKQREVPLPKYPSEYTIPYHAARMVEPIVERITAKPWTAVICDDQLLRRLISAYFYYPHPAGPFVHKDLFLEDMAAGRTRFCSSLLVNAMCAVGVQSCHDVPNRSKVWLHDSLTYKFLAEARRLWDLEPSGQSRITTIQAALVLSYTTTNNSFDRMGTMYLEQAIKMSQDLDLFGASSHVTDTKMSKARVFTAWAVYSWQGQFDYYFFRPPHLREPPQVPLPDLRLHPEWYGEVWAQYPGHQTPTRLHLGHKIQADTTLHAIMNDMALISFEEGATSSRPWTAEEIRMIKRKLDVWKDSLPEPLQPNKVLFPPHLSLLIQYHQVTIAFMKLIQTAEHLEEAQKLEICGGKCPQLILHEHEVMLETIVRLYYTHHSFEFYDPWVAFALIIVGMTAIASIATSSSDPDKSRMVDGHRSTLIMSAQGLYNQSLCYHLGTLLAVQLLNSMEARDSQLARTYVTAAGISDYDRGLIAQHSHSQWPLPIISVYEDPEKVRLDRLVNDTEQVELGPSECVARGRYAATWSVQPWIFLKSVSS